MVISDETNILHCVKPQKPADLMYGMHGLNFNVFSSDIDVG
jgi:hypothetical protein